MGLADIGGEVNSGKEKNNVQIRAGEKENIETNLDFIYNAVLEKKHIPLSKIASQFKVSIQKIEEWARVLDKQGLLQLYYPMIGEAELKVRNKKL